MRRTLPGRAKRIYFLVYAYAEGSEWGGGGCRRGSYALPNGHSATGPGMNWSLLLLGCSLLACADEHKVHTLLLKLSSELFARSTFSISLYG